MAKLGRLILILVAILAILGSESGAVPGKLAFVRGGNIWIADTDGSGTRQLTHSGKDRSPALSPDGRQVAYQVDRDEKAFYGQIYLVSSQGGTPKQFRPARVLGAEDPAFSADGKYLVFIGMSDLKTKKIKEYDSVSATMFVGVVELSVGKVNRVKSQPDSNLDFGYVYENPAFSPDGKFLAVQSSGTDVSGGFAVMDLKGKTIFNYPRDAGKDFAAYSRPRFSSDGKEILCYSPATSEDQKDTIFLINLQTGSKKQITEGRNPTWVDGGKAIVFEKWPPSRWQDPQVKVDLWRLELIPGAEPKKIITNGSEPAGQ